MHKDPVCGMEVDETKAIGTSVFNEQNYYFCSKGCQEEFDKNPAQYASRTLTPA